MPPLNPPSEIFNFQIDPSVVSWNVPPRKWMADHNKHWTGLAVGSVVFDDKGRMLLVQRAAHDSMPNRWEIPGGAADQEDGDGAEDNRSYGGSGSGSILRAAARELWEEAGLVVTRFARLVAYPQATDVATGVAATDGDHSGYVFTNRTGSAVFCRFTFQVQVKSYTPVVLDPEEHQDYAWAAEHEVREGRLADGRTIPITTAAQQAVLLKAFQQLKQDPVTGS